MQCIFCDNMCVTTTADQLYPVKGRMVIVKNVNTDYCQKCDISSLSAAEQRRIDEAIRQRFPNYKSPLDKSAKIINKYINDQLNSVEVKQMLGRRQ